MDVFLEIAVLLVLFGLNGFFAMAELAVVSSRRIRLQQMAEEGRPGAAQALALADSPGRLLSAVQVGITLIGILSGAFGGATLGIAVVLIAALVSPTGPLVTTAGLAPSDRRRRATHATSGVLPVPPAARLPTETTGIGARIAAPGRSKRRFRARTAAP